jgi:DNA replication and repair protein RecF
MLDTLRLRHFRSYDDKTFTFQPGVNIIVGPNASGKTNLLEAILVLSTGSSYRAKDTELVAFDESWARLDGSLSDGPERTMKLQLKPSPAKTYELDGKLFKRLGLARMLPVVLFEPNHLQLLTGSPELRRTYLDDILEKTKNGYGTIRRQYKRTLAQRNALLKQHLATTAQLFPWNIRLSQLAGQIVQARTELQRTIEELIGGIYKDLANTNTMVRIEYQSRWPAEGYETKLLNTLEQTLETDRLHGFTSVGPHREDFILLYNDHPAIEIASRGETRSGVLALKIIELKIIETARRHAPLLLLDDVFSELDGARRDALTHHLKQYQTFITTTDADIVARHFSNATHIISMASTED